VFRGPGTTAWINTRWWVNNPGGVIVVPNEHIENMYELPRDLAGTSTKRRAWSHWR